MRKRTRIVLVLVGFVPFLIAADSGQHKGASGTKPLAPAKQGSPSRIPGLIHHDLSDPRYTPPDAPAWLKEDFPEWIRPLVGKNGMLHPLRDKPGPLAPSVKGLDRYQANNFVFHRPVTAKYLYGEYTPLKVNYKPGTLPTYEKVVAEYTSECKTDTEKAVTLLLKALPALCKHPTVPPYGGKCRADRDLDDEALLKSGSAWCNEQARVFIRMCQVIGIPARMVHLFYSDNKTGHTLGEFYADGRWAMADVSWYCVFPGRDGKLLSAAQCHDRKQGQKYAGIAYRKRFQEIARLPREQIYTTDDKRVEKLRKELASITAEQAAAKLNSIAIINYPLPK